MSFVMERGLLVDVALVVRDGSVSIKGPLRVGLALLFSTIIFVT